MPRNVDLIETLQRLTAAWDVGTERTADGTEEGNGEDDDRAAISTRRAMQARRPERHLLATSEPS